MTKLTRDNFKIHQKEIVSIERRSFSSPWSWEAFSAEVERPVSHFWMAQMNGEVVGYICFWLVAQEIHLMNFAVHPVWRRTGVGRKLMGKALDTGRSAGAQAVSLEVRPSNTRARAFYRELGFTVIGRRPRYYDDTNEDAIIMVVLLTTEPSD
ncbi:MAG: ribosomal protein S18-alanine N-acetyltransferase [Desulfobacteraceae bacterium]